MNVRTCEIMQYIDYLPYDYSVFCSRVLSFRSVKTYAVILHDKDVYENGEPKAPHLHCVLTFTMPVSIDSLASYFSIEPQYINKIKTTTAYAQLYLLHRNDITKYQYSVSDLTTNVDYDRLFSDNKKPKSYRLQEIINSIADGSIRQFNYTSYISADEYIRNKNKIDFAFKYRADSLRGRSRSMNCIYICGASGVGKSTFAQLYAKQNSCNGVYVSSGGKNPLDDYANEDCIVFDDFRAENYSLSDFLKLTDNHIDSAVSARFYNKNITECRYFIVTCSLDFPTFCRLVATDNNKVFNEDIIKSNISQIVRRFPLVIKMDMDNIRMYSTYSSNGTYVFSDKLLDTQINPVPQLAQIKKSLPKLGFSSDELISACADFFGLDSSDYKKT